MVRQQSTVMIRCPSCKKKTITVVHQPFVTLENMSKCRFGIGGPVYTKEKTEVLSGCSACGKSKIDI